MTIHIDGETGGFEYLGVRVCTYDGRYYWTMPHTGENHSANDVCGAVRKIDRILAQAYHQQQVTVGGGRVR